MLKQWTVENFKSIYERTTIKLAPLTIFAGANSSGKSTVIQSILLAAQTIQSPVQFRPIVLNGHILRLGAFDDIVSNANKSENVTFGFELSSPITIDETDDLTRYGSTYFAYGGYDLIEHVTGIECQFSFSAKGKADELEALQLQPRLERTSLKINAKEQSELFEKAANLAHVEFLISRYQGPVRDRAAKFQVNEQQLSAVLLASLEYDVSRPSSFKRDKRFYGGELPSSGRVAGASFSHFLPAGLSISYDVIEENAKKLFEYILNPREGRFSASEIEGPWAKLDPGLRLKIIGYIETCIEPLKLQVNHRFHGTFEELRQTFSFRTYQRTVALMTAQMQQLYRTTLIENSASLLQMLKAGKSASYQLSFVPLQGIADTAVDYVKIYYSNRVKYLGPLRDEPKPVYPIAGASDPKDVGFKGEHTAAVLDVHKHTQVEYLPSFVFSSLGANAKPIRVSLIDAISDWLNYLGVVTNVVTFDKGKLGHELKVSTNEGGELHDLTHVGVGVSQVLPILVMSLLAPVDSTLIFEQPELHLHPRVQTRLADFFVSMTYLHKQCIVETHSEYMINRLRYIAVIDEADLVSDRSIVYFVEKIKGHSHYRPLTINEYGVIGNWPTGFFDESDETASALLRAALEKRAKRALKSNA